MHPAALVVAATLAGVALGLDAVVEVDDRAVVVHIPECAAAAPNASLPLVLSLHAWGSDAATQQTVDNFGALSEVGCFAVAWPQGLKHGWGPFVAGYQWNAGGCCPDPRGGITGIDDVTFLSDVMDALRDTYPDTIHPTLNFVTGISNGGMMTNRLACELGERVTAIAPVSGSVVNGTDEVGEPFECASARPIPVLHFHGASDPIVPYGGCNATWSSFCEPLSGCTCLEMHAMVDFADFAPVVESIDGWRAINGVLDGAAARVSFENGTVTCTTFGDSAATNVTLCVAADEGHAWPGTPDSVSTCEAPMFHCTQDIDASAQIWAFFGSVRTALGA